MRTLIVIPAYNEARNLPGVLDSLRAAYPTWDLLVVDDGSSDDTATVAAAHGARVLRLPFNLGIGGAVQAGLLYAARHDYDVCAQIDGDGQHNAAETARLIEELQTSGADAVIGSRFLPDSPSGYRPGLRRRIGITILRTVISRLTGQRVTDPTSGQRVLGRRAIALLAPVYPQEYPEPEALHLMLRAGLRVIERPVTMNARRHGVSSIGGLDALLYMAKVLGGILVRASTRSTRVMT
jgi:glycosyltransferase involved in cell wall biosynthesis